MARILKGDRVEFQGRALLGEAVPVCEAPKIPAEQAAPDQGVRIVDAKSDHTLIEVVCDCGKTVMVRCDHP